MPRKIKFRAWDEYENRMISTEDLGNQTWNVLGNLQWGQGNWKFMQFTGLKDKNGKEIYEGDILSDTDWGLGAVVWDEINGQWILNCKLDHTALHFVFPSEIIGNIYENPELIKKHA